MGTRTPPPKKEGGKAIVPSEMKIPKRGDVGTPRRWESESLKKRQGNDQREGGDCSTERKKVI